MTRPARPFSGRNDGHLDVSAAPELARLRTLHPTITTSVRAALPVLLLLAACSNGGKEDRPQSQVTISASHHTFGFRSLRGFGTFPVSADVIFTDHGTLNLFDDSTYTITRTTGTSAADRYALESGGDFSLFVTGGGNEPSVVFNGAYGLVATNADLCFTDRVSTPNSQSIGLYVGTRVVAGAVELEGAWHLLSLHAVFNQTILSPENVGRGAHGAVAIGAGAPGTARSLSGSGNQGTSSLTFGGTIQNLLTNGSGDGTCNLTVNYALQGQTADSRVMLAAATQNLVLGLDAEESDGEAGLLFLVRAFDAPSSPVDSVRVPGRFLVAGHTLFVNPSNSGSDAFVGVVTLTAQGGFRLDAVGSQGQSSAGNQSMDFTYLGSYTLAANGGMTISISGTNETWFAAIDRGYQTFAFVDDFVEVRSNNTPELNLGFGVREKTN